MRCRKLDANGDYSFGHPQQDFYRDTPQAVAQAVKTRLALLTGEWFLDTADGMPWRAEVLGQAPAETVDRIIRERILGTPGVVQIVRLTRSFDRAQRVFTLAVTLDTAYGPATVTTPL